MHQAVPRASSPFRRFARFGKMHQHEALGFRPKLRKGFTLSPIPLRRGFLDNLNHERPAFPNRESWTLVVIMGAKHCCSLAG